jgi:gamma-glutamyl-gamma-aminobutyrate hydrolase PuuD
MRPKVFVVDSDVRITRMFMANNWLVVPSAKEADLIQFTGGADVSPMLYGEPKHPRTYCDPNRDQHEANIFWNNIDKPKAGICRGGQFLNVMSGGSMWQDVDNHAIGGTHAAVFWGVSYKLLLPTIK